MAKKFDFLSPGINIREIDQSFIPAERDAEGPIIIGRTRKGPANKPVKIRNLDDYVSIFGLPIPGGAGAQGDVWRDGNTTGPTYASYAAQAWLASEESPVTVVRLAGEQHPQANAAGYAGWKLSGSLSSTIANNSTAYGLFLISSASAVNSGQSQNLGTGSLAAIFYANKGALALNGTELSSGSATTSQAGTFIKSVGSNCEFKLDVYNESDNLVNTFNFNFGRNSANYLRSVFNTNPQLVNESTVATAQRETYWLGESFAREIEDLSLLSIAAGGVAGILLPLQSGSAGDNWGTHQESAQEAGTGFVISQKSKGQVDLFRLKSLHVGEDIQKDYMVAIEQIAEPPNPVVNPFGSFTVCIKTLSGQTVERYVNVNFNPSSPDYIAKRIGDQYLEWDETNRRYRTYGDFQNQSNIVYIDLKQFIKDGGGQGYLPAGFKGPVRPKGFTLLHGSQGPNALGDVVNTGTAATATITIGSSNTGTNCVDATTVTITDHTGLAKVYEFKNNGGSASGTNTKISDGSGDIDAAQNQVIAAALKTAVEAAQDITVTQGSAPNQHVLTLTQNTSGPDGNVTITSSGATVTAKTGFSGGSDDDDFGGAFVLGNASMPKAGGDANTFVKGPSAFTASFNFPSLALRGNGTEGGAPDPYRAYYGIRPKISSTSTQHDPDYCDYLRRLPGGGANFTPANANMEHSFIFTLDDIIIDLAANTVTYTSGAYGSNTSYTYGGGTGSFGALLEKNVRQFLMPLHGGSDGLNITEKEPFRDDLISSTRDDKNDYIHYTLNKALDSIRDPEVVPANLLLMPGIRKPVITNRVISVADSRQDVLALIDLENDYKPSAERRTQDTNANSLGSVASAVSSLKSRNLNSSYAAAFYPWVQISDNLNGSNLVWIPPSIAALGALGRSQATSELWFAPAGFNRGGLGSLGGARGPRVLQTRQRLDSKERDSLYEVNINPIATFPAEGVVIFGQKTLQADQSALDRINVRRLVLYLKSRVSEVSRNLLFDQNLSSTWNRFKSQVNPILSDTRARFGLSDYKLILDDTTTTADLVDRNIMYAKIYIKPARAIEYIVVDFVITRTGADFV